MRARGEPPSALLILSAVDLLLASLVCATVLLIALVGAPAASKDASTGSTSGSPAPIEVLYPVEPRPGQPPLPDLTVSGALPIGSGAPAPAASTDLEAYRFGIDARRQRWPWQWRAFVAQADSARLALSNLPSLAFVSIHLGAEGTYHVLLQCRQPGWSFQIALKPVRVIDDTCADRNNVPAVPGRVPPVPYMVVSDESVQAIQWGYLNNMPDQGGMLYQWRGPELALPPHVSSAVFVER